MVVRLSTPNPQVAFGSRLRTPSRRAPWPDGDPLQGACQTKIPAIALLGGQGAAGRATRLYDRTNDAISLDEIERILI
jgi:hypothetical protein